MNQLAHELKRAIPPVKVICVMLSLLGVSAIMAMLGVDPAICLTVASMSTMTVLWFFLAWTAGVAAFGLMNRPVRSRLVVSLAAGTSLMAGSLPLLDYLSKPSVAALSAQNEMLNASMELVLVTLCLAAVGLATFVIRGVRRKPAA